MASRGALRDRLRSFEIVSVDVADALAAARSGDRFRIPTRSGGFDVALRPRDLRARPPAREARKADGDDVSIDGGRVRTFAGTVPDVEGMTARFTIDEEGMSGVLLAGEVRRFIEPLANYRVDARPDEFVLYDAEDVIPEETPGTCATTDAEALGVAEASLAPKVAGVQNRVVDLATETDNEYVAAFSSPQAANDEILSIMNQVEGVYDAELGLTFRIVFQNTYTGPDPYTSTTSPSALLEELRARWNAAMTGIARDVVHMWTGRDLDGTTLGIAYTDVVCNNPTAAYGLSQRYTAVPQKYGVTAHEIGHNFGACHADVTSCNPNPSTCANTIMESVIRTGFTFCEFSRNQIRSHVTMYPSCLSLETPSAGTTTVGLYAPATATFFLRNSNTPGAATVVFAFGPPNARPLAGDWDGNGTTTVGIYIAATATFFLTNANAPGPASITVGYGPPGAVPIVGDWDGNGTTTIGIYVPTSGAFFLRNSNTAGAADIVFSYGPANVGFVPIAGDWDGDGRDGVGIYDPATGTFFLKSSLAGGPADTVVSFGPPGATPLAGDWTGIGRDTIGIYVAATSVFFLRNSLAPGPADIVIPFGAPPAIGIVGNWDGA